MFKDFCSNVGLKPADSLCASSIEYTYNNNHLTAVCPGQPG